MRVVGCCANNSLRVAGGRVKMEVGGGMVGENGRRREACFACFIVTKIPTSQFTRIECKMIKILESNTSG